MHVFDNIFDGEWRCQESYDGSYFQDLPRKIFIVLVTAVLNVVTVLRDIFLKEIPPPSRRSTYLRPTASSRQNTQNTNVGCYQHSSNFYFH